MPKIVILDGYTENPGDLSWVGFTALGELIVYDRTAPGDVVRRIGDAEIAYTNKTLLPRDVLFACPNLRFIGVLATGYNVVDVAAAKEKGADNAASGDAAASAADSGPKDAEVEEAPKDEEKK